MATNPIRGRRPTWVKWSIRIGVALFLYTIIGFFVLPAIIKSQLLKRLPPIVLRPVSIEQVRVNPYALSLTLRGFAIKETNGDNFISFDELYVNFQLSSIFRRKFTFAEISVKKPLAQITYLPEGVFNFANILTNLPPSPPGPPKPPPPLLVFQLSITNGAVAFVDLTRKTPFRTQFTPIDVDLTNLTTVRDKNSPYSIVARTGEGETFAWGGNVSINPLRSAGTFRLGGLALSKYAPYEQDYARFQIAGGKVDVAADYRYDSVVNALDGEVSNAVVHLDKFELKDGDTGETVLSIPSLSVEDASAAVLAHNARVGKIKSTGGFVLARQNHDGSINLLSQLILPTNHPPAAAAGTNAPSPLAAPWTARIDEIAFDNYSLKVEDHKPTTPASIDIDQLAFDIKNVSNVSNAPVSASLNLRLQQTGTVAVEGTATLLPPSADLNLTVSNIDLRVAQPYVHDQVKLIISSGGVNVHGRARYAAPEPGAPLASFTGDFALNNFLTTDDVLFKDFLKWNTLNVDGIKLAVLPNSLHVDQVKLNGLDTSVIVGPDKRPNIQTILRKDTNAMTAAAITNGTRVATADSAPGEQSETRNTQHATVSRAPLPPVSLDKLILENASLHFSDQSLEPHCSFAVAEFGGTIEGLSSQPGTTATVDVKGKVDDRSPFVVSGRVNPLAEDLFADISVTFTNTELTPFSPYTEKLAGRPLEKGKLSFAVHYLVQTNELKAENGFFIDQMTLGAWNNSPDATSLPVKLAIALLKDRNGRISLDVPVHGRIDDPKFSIGPIIWHVIGNLIVKAATSPFSLLGAAFGGGEEMSFVDFQPGHVELQNTDTNKLNTLAKALFERPNVSLEISGAADPAGDREALSRVRADEQVKALWLADQGNKTNIALADVKLDPKEYERYVRRAYRQKFGSYRPGELVTGPQTNKSPATARSAAVTAARFNPIDAAGSDHGAFLLMGSAKPPVKLKLYAPASSSGSSSGAATPGQPPRELTPREVELLDMEDQLAKAIVITDDDLRDLMQARANRVQKYLLDTGKVTGDRLFITAPHPLSSAGHPQPRVNLSLD